MDSELFLCLKNEYETTKGVSKTCLLTFNGVDGYDVYNCSVPFRIGNKRYMYGRVERFDGWAASFVRLFTETGEDEWTAVDSVDLPLEDPFVSLIHDEIVLGGTHVLKSKGRIQSYRGYFYRGKPEAMELFTCGPDKMKDIRLIDLNGKIGVFSRPKGEGKVAIGFTVIDSIDELDEYVISSAEPIEGVIGGGVWGGINQAYLLDSGLIGCLAHSSVEQTVNGQKNSVYVCSSFIFDPETMKTDNYKIIATASDFPDSKSKLPRLCDCVFTSGMTPRPDGRFDLYAGVRDVCEGRKIIKNPFEGYGKIIIPEIKIN